MNPHAEDITHQEDDDAELGAMLFTYYQCDSIDQDDVDDGDAADIETLWPNPEPGSELARTGRKLAIETLSKLGDETPALEAIRALSRANPEIFPRQMVGCSCLDLHIALSFAPPAGLAKLLQRDERQWYGQGLAAIAMYLEFAERSIPTAEREHLQACGFTSALRKLKEAYLAQARHEELNPGANPDPYTVGRVLADVVRGDFQDFGDRLSQDLAELASMHAPYRVAHAIDRLREHRPNLSVVNGCKPLPSGVASHDAAGGLPSIVNYYVAMDYLMHVFSVPAQQTVDETMASYRQRFAQSVSEGTGVVHH